MSTKEKMEVVSIDMATGEQKMFSMEEAVEILSRYWIRQNIESELRKGAVLWTPFYQYKIQND